MQTRVSLTVALFIASHALAQSNLQPGFATPEAAARALVKSVQDGNTQTTVAILGPEMRDTLEARDPNLLKLERDLFLLAARRSVKVEKESDTRAIVYFGEQEWPFPAPLVRNGQTWQFDGKEGIREIEDRVIGRQELAAVAACRGYVAAQLDYSSSDWNDDGILEYAQRLTSSPGKKDGLFWSSDDGGVPSPLGPFFAAAEASREDKQPLAGYYFKILTRQGPDARGGARDYMYEGHLVLGFALVAWPADYGKSGVSTFLINQLGDVYEKDLGDGTAKTVEGIDQFNPDSSWKKLRIED